RSSGCASTATRRPGPAASGRGPTGSPAHRATRPRPTAQFRAARPSSQGSRPDDEEAVMATQLSPYLNFDGDAREAVEFYGRVFGTTPDISTYDSVGPVDDPALAAKVLHAQLTIEGVGTLMASDVPPGTTLTDRASVALSGETGDRERLRAWFAALSEGAPGLTAKIGR